MPGAKVGQSNSGRIKTSVVDPDQYVFGPPGSFLQQTKKVRKTLISTIF
jgi:hypothetical protein